MSEPVNPSDFNRPRQEILSAVDVDGLGQAVLTLCHELWIIRDRMAILEAVLSRHGIDAAAEIEAHEPDAALKERLREDGRALIARVVGALNNH